jgi:hypothetical protein
MILQIRQGSEVQVAYQISRASVSAVAAVRPAFWNELLAPKAHAASPAVASGHADSCLVYETHIFAPYAIFEKNQGHLPSLPIAADPIDKILSWTIVRIGNRFCRCNNGGKFPSGDLGSKRDV